MPSMRSCGGPPNLFDRRHYYPEPLGIPLEKDERKFILFTPGEDIVKIWVSRWDRAEEHQAMIGLSFSTIGPYFSGWAKEVQGWGCNGPTSTIIHLGPGHGGGTGYTRWMKISGTSPTNATLGLLLRKPKEFGNWYNMYYFAPDLWYYISKRVIEFEWWADSRL